MGREVEYQIHIIQKAWNCYLRLVDIDYDIQFTCPICKVPPSIIILDGISMVTTKQLPDRPSHIDQE